MRHKYTAQPIRGKSYPPYYLSQSEMKLTKLVILGDTKNFLRFEIKYFLAYCLTFLSWEWFTSQGPYSGGKCPWSYCKHCWMQNTSGYQCNLHFLNFILLHLVVFSCIISKWKEWGNSKFKSYYLHLDFMEIVSILDTSHKTIMGFWHSSDILKGINNFSAAWVEVSVKCWKECGASLCEHRNVNICCSCIYIYTYIHTHKS